MDRQERAHIAKGGFTYASVDGAADIRAVYWVRDDVDAAHSPRAVVQLIHGMGEHIGRYDRFARYLASQGYLVCGNDSVGHGKTATEANEAYGLLPAKDPVDVLVKDVERLRRLLQEDLSRRYPGRRVPHFMFGHSMGSLVLRCYLPRFGEGLAGAAICGTTMPARPLSLLGVVASKALIALKGPQARSKILQRLAYGVYSSKIKNARTPFDWISSDPDEVDRFIDDEATGFAFSGPVYLALTEAAYTAARKRSLEHVPKDLPLLLISGDEDPVGDFGRQVERLANRLRSVGVKSTTLKLYGGMRHETLNEYGRGEVFSDVVSWFAEIERESAGGVAPGDPDRRPAA